MKVTSTVKLSEPMIKNLERAAIRALERTADKLHEEVVQAQVVPRMDGTLSEEAFFVDCSRSEEGKVQLVHNTPYARRLYYHPEYKFQKEPWEEDVKNKDGTVSHVRHEGNPNAKGKWYEDWEPGGRKAGFIPDTFETLFKEESGL